MSAKNTSSFVGVCGYGYTGSGAVLDLLKEYDVKVLDEDEFVFSYLPDCLEDLEYQLTNHKARFFSSDIAIKRFLDSSKKLCKTRSIYRNLTDGKLYDISKEFVNSIIDLSWKGTWMYDIYFCPNEFLKTLKYRILMRFINPKSNLYKKIYHRDMFLCIDPSEFTTASQNLIEKIFANYLSEKMIVLNQPFAANNPQKSMKFFGKNAKAIIVDRDPRDVYILSKQHVNASWIPNERVEDFVVYYKKLHENSVENNNIMYLKYEDLIYHYDSTVSSIEMFLGLTEKNHYKKDFFFKPSVSINNTQLFVKNEYKKDIEVIEKELADYLYFFDKPVVENNNCKVF